MMHSFYNVTKLTLLFSYLYLSPNAYSDNKWNDANNPRNLDSSYKLNFNQLPTKGDVTKNSYRGWSDSYWPKTRGLIADRWQDPNYNQSRFSFRNQPKITALDVRTLSENELNLLSPAEKFDIARGKLDFPLSTTLKKDEPEIKDWWRGLCNGWTHASINIDEPHPITYESPQSKIKIKFNSGDIKGLMAYYYSYRDVSGARYIGKSCRAAKKLLLGLDGACKDVNAGAFHVALANEIGIKNGALAVDRDPSIQVWNQPFVKFETTVDQVISKNEDDVKKVLYVTSLVTFVNELYKINPSELNSETSHDDLEDDLHATPSAEPVLGTELQSYKTVTYKYTLELDSRDNIIGGMWLNGSEPNPDLIWKQNFKMPAIGYDDKNKADNWSVLSEIIKLATSYAYPDVKK